MKERWTRRQILQTSAKFAALSALAPFTAACAPQTLPEAPTKSPELSTGDKLQTAEAEVTQIVKLQTTEAQLKELKTAQAVQIESTQEPTKPPSTLEPSPTTQPTVVVKLEPSPSPKPTREKPKLYELTQTATPKPEIKIENLKVLWQKKLKRPYGEIRSRTWHFPTTPYSHFPFVVSRDAIFLTTPKDSKESRFASFDLSTGDKLWPEKAGFTGFINGIPISVWGDTVWFLPSYETFDDHSENSLYGFSVKDGKEKFKVDFVPRLSNVPVASENKLFFVKNKDISYSTHFLVELDQETGQMQEKTVVSAPNQYLNVLGVTRDYLVITYEDVTGNSSTVDHYLPVTGVVARNTWEQLTVRMGRSGRPLFLGTANDNKTSNELLLALSIVSRRDSSQLESIAALKRTGRLFAPKWEIPSQKYPIWLTDNLLLVGMEPKGLIALEPQTGVTLWKTDKVRRDSTIFEIEGGNIYLSTDNGVGLFNKEQDKIIWEFDRWRKRKDGSKEMSGLTDAILFGNSFVFEHNLNLVFLNKETGEESRPGIQLGWWPVNFYQAGKLLIVEGRDQIAVVG